MHNKGFSLIELMVVIAIVGIVSIIALPQFSSLISGMRVSSQTNDLVAAMNLARSEAVKRNASVGLCPSSDGAACVAGSTSWSSGWIVYLVTGGTVLRVNSALSGGNTLTASAGGAVIFLPSGQASSIRSFNLCAGTSGGGSRSVSVSIVGRVQSVNPGTC